MAVDCSRHPASRDWRVSPDTAESDIARRPSTNTDAMRLETRNNIMKWPSHLSTEGFGGRRVVYSRQGAPLTMKESRHLLPGERPHSLAPRYSDGDSNHAEERQILSHNRSPRKVLRLLAKTYWPPQEHLNFCNSYRHGSRSRDGWCYDPV